MDPSTATWWFPAWSDDDDSAHRLGESTRDMGNVENRAAAPTMSWVNTNGCSDGRRDKLTASIRRRKETMEQVKGILSSMVQSNVLIPPPGPVMRLCRPATGVGSCVSARRFILHENDLSSRGRKPMRIIADDAQHALSCCRVRRAPTGVDDARLCAAGQRIDKRHAGDH